MSFKKSFLSFMLLIVLLNGCGQPTSPSLAQESPQVNIKEASTSTATEAEEIYLNNCGNSASSEQTSERSQTIAIEGGAELGTSAEVIKASIEGKYVETKGVKKARR